MPSAGKVESYTVHCEQGGDHHDVRATQPRWLLRKKTYKPLPPGLPDYAVGKDWMPSAPSTPDNTKTSVRLKQSHVGVQDAHAQRDLVDHMKNTVQMPPRSFSTPSDVSRVDVPSKSTGTKLLKLGDIPDGTSNKVVRVAASKVDHMKMQMMGDASTSRKISDISRYYEELGHARVGQLLRDRQGGLECIRT